MAVTVGSGAVHHEGWHDACVLPRLLQLPNNNTLLTLSKTIYSFKIRLSVQMVILTLIATQYLLYMYYSSDKSTVKKDHNSLSRSCISYEVQIPNCLVPVLCPHQRSVDIFANTVPLFHHRMYQSQFP